MTLKPSLEVSHKSPWQLATLEATYGCVLSSVFGLLPILLLLGFSTCLEPTQSISTGSLLYAQAVLLAWQGLASLTMALN